MITALLYRLPRSHLVHKVYFKSLLAALLLGLSMTGWTHNSFGNRLQITPGDGFWLMEWSAPVDELNVALGIDSDNNQLIHWWEIEAAQSQIASYAKTHFFCQPRLSCGPLKLAGALQVLPANEGTGARLTMRFSVPVYDEIEALKINWLLAQNPHRPMVLQWFREGGWQLATVHTGAVIELNEAVD